MPTLDDAIRRLDQLLEVLENPHSAYVIRSRFDRLLVVTRKYVQARSTTAAAPSIHALLHELEAGFEALRRRSEPFGESWMQKLTEVEGVLRQLRRALT